MKDKLEEKDNIKYIKLRDVADVTSGKRLPKGYELDSTPTNLNQKYLRVTDMTNFKVEELKFVPDEVVPLIERYRIYEDEIYISVAGTLGVVGKISAELSGINLTENANRISNFKGDTDFLLQYLMSNKIKNLIDAEQTVGAQPKLALDRIRNFPIPNYGIEQQRKIGKLLSSMDQLIEYTKVQSENIENKKSFMLNKIFNDKLFNSKFEFEYFELGDIADIKTGYTPPTVDEENFDGPYTWFGVVDMKKKYISKSNRTLTEKSYKESKLIPKNTLLMSFKLTVGKLAFNSVDCFTNEAIANFEFKENILDEYMYYALENSDISSYGSQAAQGITLNNQSLKTIIVPITGIDNQKHISDILLELDNLKELYKQYSDELKNIKKYNLNKIFQ